MRNRKALLATIGVATCICLCWAILPTWAGQPTGTTPSVKEIHRGTSPTAAVGGSGTVTPAPAPVLLTGDETIVTPPVVEPDVPADGGPRAPQIIYRNEDLGGVNSYFAPGVGKLMGDDLALAVPTHRTLIEYSVNVYAPSGTPAYTVTAQIYTANGSSIGSPIIGTDKTWNMVGAGEQFLTYTLPASVAIPDNVWLVVGFSNANAGWLMGGPAEVGTSADRFAYQNTPPTWGYYWFSGNPLANFECVLTAEEGTPPIGACCRLSGACVADTTQTQCDSLCGTWYVGQTCAQISCQPCTISCTGTPEGEPQCAANYTDTTNGGCNSTPNVFGAISCGETICGTSGTYAFGTAQRRDTDWFQIVVNDTTPTVWKKLTVTLTAKFNWQVLIIDGTNGCSASTVVAAATGFPCGPTPVTACVPNGTYWIWVGPSDWSTCWACSDSPYKLQLACEPCPAPTGACCHDDDTNPNGCRVCTVQQNESDCLTIWADWNPVWKGLNTTCAEVDCNDVVAACCIPPQAACACKGDVNGDGSVNGKDIQCFVSVFLGSPLPGCNAACADMDGGGVAASDIAPFVTAVLNGACARDGGRDGCVYCQPMTCPDCQAAGGTWQPDVPNCDLPNSCLPDLACGACCFFSGGVWDCQIVTVGVDGSSPECDALGSPNVLSIWGTCDTANCGSTCSTPCPADAHVEVEGCGLDYNGGCNVENATPANFELINCGQKVCGTAWALGGLRDTDWYAFSVGDQNVTVTGKGNFPFMMLLVSDTGLASCQIDIVAEAYGDACTPAVLTANNLNGQYYLFVSTGTSQGGIFDGIACANYQFELTCSAVPPCDPQVVCGGGTPENEACGGDTNGGCNSTPEAFQNITCGQSICGTVWANAGNRDTDWYQFTLTGERDVTWAAQSELPVALFLISSPCSGLSVLASGYASCGVPGQATARLPAGTYYAFVATGDSNGGIFNGYPCGSNNGNDYKATLTCTVPPTGACCQNGVCVATVTETQCATNYPGSYWFQGQTCPAFSCPTQPTGACCVGTNCVATTTLYQCVVGLGGSFVEGQSCPAYVCQTTYCAAGSGTCDEYIARVIVGTIDNLPNPGTGCGTGGYTDYRSLSTNVTRGQAYTIDVVPGIVGQGYGYYYTGDRLGIWVDWNRDGDFADANETIYTGDLAPNFGATINVPPGASVGPTGLRVRIHYTDEATAPCGNAVYGEVEDYTLNVQ